MVVVVRGVDRGADLLLAATGLVDVGDGERDLASAIRGVDRDAGFGFLDETVAFGGGFVGRRRGGGGVVLAGDEGIGDDVGRGEDLSGIAVGFGGRRHGVGAGGAAEFAVWGRGSSPAV